MSVQKQNGNIFKCQLQYYVLTISYLLQKISGMSVYTKLIELIKNKEFPSTALLTIAKSLLKEILAVSESEAEKARLKYAVTSF